MIFPLLWMITTSFKTPNEVLSYPPTWVPQSPTLGNYRQVFREIPILRYYINSIMVSLIVTASSLVLCSLAGFGFAKYTFFGHRFFFVLILRTLMIPLYILSGKLGLVNTYWGIAAPSIGSAFGTFLMRQYIKAIPNELLDVSRIDGCTEFRIFREIILPMCKPALATLIIFMVIFSWNDFLWPLIIVGPETISRRYLEIISSIDGMEVTGVVGRTEEKTKSYAEKYGIAVFGTCLQLVAERTRVRILGAVQMSVGGFYGGYGER